MLFFNKLDELFPPVVRWGVGALLVVGGGASVYHWIRNRKTTKRRHNVLTKGEVDNPYESVKLLNEYLSFNYGGPAVNCLYGEPHGGFDFPKQTAEVCLKYHKSEAQSPSRALDIGCAVGRASFELAREFSEVIGIDFSHGFVKTCNALKQSGRMEYEVATEGSLTTKHEACVPSDLKRSNCHFRQGDACNLPLDLGQFSCVLAANLICRLPRPKDFLMRLSSLVAPGGICVIASPYTFMEDYTRKELMLGGYVDEHGKEVRGLGTITQLLSPHFDLEAFIDLPFLIRETARKHQWTVSHVTVWRRKY